MTYLNLDMSTVLFALGGLEITFSLVVFILVGFAAQTIDGALGMAYGVSSNSFLLSVGVPAPVASASVHIAEIATTAVSGLAHHNNGNVDKKLFKKLVVPGVIGSIIGAFLLSCVWQMFSGTGKIIIKIVISIYLLVMGIRILLKAFSKEKENNEFSDGVKFKALACIGGFSDAIGGGGWGPIVTSTLISKGHHPRYTIGSVNTAEFFVTAAQVVVFISMIKIMNWQVIIGLIIGGCISAPFAAKLCKHIPHKAMMIIVAVVIIGLQIYSLAKNIILL